MIMDQERLFDLMTKKLAGEANEAELAEFDVLLGQGSNRTLYEQVQEQWNRVPTPPASFDTEAELTRLTAHLQIAPMQDVISDLTPSVRPLWRQSWFQAAAAVVVFALLAILWRGYQAEISTAGTESDLAAATPTIYQVEIGQAPKRFELPDGSFVWLNAGSRLTIAADFGVAVRAVSLVGEAFFDVQRDTLHRFIVQTGTIHTQVLGTSFNVSAYKREPIQVSVATGWVQVSDSAKHQVRLNPSDQVVIHSDTQDWEKGKVPLAHIASWREGVIWLNGSMLSEVVNKFERRFGHSFVMAQPETGTCKLYGKVSMQNISGLLFSLQQIYNIDYEYHKNKEAVYLSGGDCLNR